MMTDEKLRNNLKMLNEICKEWELLNIMSIINLVRTSEFGTEKEIPLMLSALNIFLSYTK